jgi:hypothetical protein
MEEEAEEEEEQEGQLDSTCTAPLLKPSHTSSPSAVISQRTSHPFCRSESHLGARGSSPPSLVAPAHHAVAVQVGICKAHFGNWFFT